MNRQDQQQKEEATVGSNVDQHVIEVTWCDLGRVSLEPLQASEVPQDRRRTSLWKHVGPASLTRLREDAPTVSSSHRLRRSCRAASDRLRPQSGTAGLPPSHHCMSRDDRHSEEHVKTEERIGAIRYAEREGSL